MKKETAIETSKFHDCVDKRELVNIDLYGHEIKVIVEQLSAIAKKHPASKEIQQKVEHFKKEFRQQEKNLEKFRKNCEPEEIDKYKERTKKEGEMQDKTFFEKLSAFENQFKTLRQDANSLVNRWL